MKDIACKHKILVMNIIEFAVMCKIDHSGASIASSRSAWGKNAFHEEDELEDIIKNIIYDN